MRALLLTLLLAGCSGGEDVAQVQSPLEALPESAAPSRLRMVVTPAVGEETAAAVAPPR